MKKSTFIKSVHKTLRDAGIVRGSSYESWINHVRYESYLNPREIYIEVISARNHSLSGRAKQLDKVCEVLTLAGIKHTYPQGIFVYINFKDNGVED